VGKMNRDSFGSQHFSSSYILYFRMKRPVRSEDGTYSIDGKKYKELFGSRIQVWNGTAYKTSGELTRKDLMMNKWNRIVSQKKHKTAKKEKRLQKYGYFAEKGKFGYVKKESRKMKNKSKKMRGGDVVPSEDATKLGGLALDSAYKMPATVSVAASASAPVSSV